MKKFKVLLASLCMMLLFSSCGMTSNLSQNANLQQTNVVLSQNNYHVIKSVESEVSSTYWFGIGGLSKKALKNNAIAELTEKAELQGSQALINVSVKSSSRAILFFNKVTFCATGTVIEFFN